MGDRVITPRDERDLYEADDEWEGKALARAMEADDEPNA